jgi:hypothetical protein
MMEIYCVFGGNRRVNVVTVFKLPKIESLNIAQKSTRDREHNLPDEVCLVLNILGAGRLGF